MADDFDAIFNAPAPAGGQARDEYDDLFARPRNTAPVELKVIEDSVKPPEQAVETLKATRQLGEPYGLGTPETVARAKAQTALKTIQENPFAQDYIEGNPAAAQASGDDWENLNAFSKAWQVLNAPDPMGRLATALGAQALGTGVRKGFLAERQGLAYIAGDREGAARFEREIAALPTAGSGIPYYAELVGSMIGQLGLDLGTGGLAGGAAGSVVPAVGTAFGAAGGTAAVNSNAAMGRFLMNLDKASAETGQPIDEATRFGTAAAFGAINTGANMIGIKSAAGAATELLAEAAARAAVQPGVGAAVGRMVTQVGKGGAVGGGLMSTMAATEAVLADAAKASAGQEQTIFTDPARREEVVGQVAQAFADGFLLMGGLHALPAGRNFVNDLRLTREAAAGKEALQGLMETREASATWQRMPELMAEFGKLHGDNTITVVGEGAARLPETLGMVMPDGARVVSLAEYAAAVPMDLHRAIADDIQHGPDAISVNEGKLIADYHSSVGRFATREQPPAAANEAGAVFDTWESRRDSLAAETETLIQQGAANVAADLDALLRGEEPSAQRLNLPNYQTGVKTVVDAFHGTTSDFISSQGFSDTSRGGATSAPSAGEAHFFARNPETSNTYADIQAANAQPNMVQARLTFNNPFVFDFNGQSWRDQSYFDLIAHAKTEGHDGVIFLNTYDGGFLDVIYGVFDTDQIGQRLDNNPRRAAEGAQTYMAKGVQSEVTAANTRDSASGVANTERANATPEPTPIEAQAQADMQGMYLQPLFPDASAVGMTEPEFARYSKLLEGRAKAIASRNQRAAARDAAVELTPTYKAREELVREEATRNVDDRPVIVAERMARTGESPDGSGSGGFKLDREVVDAVSRPGTSDLLRGLVKRGGMHPDELAELVGYGSGAELVQDLVAMKVERDRLGLSPAKYREKLIGEETRLRMEERFGLLPEEIEARAREAAVMPATTEILNAEREFLAAKAGATAGASLGEMRQAVATEFAGLPAKQARDLRAYMRAVTRAGREAELALLRQDFAKAFDAKQRQQVAHLFAEQAKAFGKTERKAGQVLRQYSENVTLDAVSQRYVNQIQGIVQRFDIPQKRNLNDLFDVLTEEGSLSRFIDARNAELGGLIPDAELPQRPLGEYTVADTAQLHDLLQALDFQGRAEKKIEIDGQQRALAEVVGEGVANLEALPDRFDPNKAGMKAVLDKFLRMADAPLLKMEQLFEWFDHHDTEGVFHRMVVKPLHAAQGLRDDMFVSLGKQLRALDQGKEWNRKLNDEVPNQTLIDPFDPANPRPMRFTRKNLLGLMLNMGNEGNFQVLTKGYSWDPGAVVDFVNRNATAKDWAWVQGIWDTFGSLEPQVKATYRELAGVAPDMVVPNEIVTPHGTFKGGYFPLIKDVLRNNERAESLEANLFQRGQIQPLPANGYTKSRTGITYPLELNPDLVPAYLRATAHDIAFRGAVIRANKFLNSPEIQLAVKKTFGPEYAREFFPYLRDIANDGVSDVAGISYLNRMIAGARNRTIAALIGLNPGTVMIHGGSAAFNSIGELAHQFGWKRAIASTPKFVGTALGEVATDAIRVGQKAADGAFGLAAAPAAKVLPRQVNEMVGRAYQSTIGRLTRSPVEFNRLWNEAIEQSPEMRHRMHNFDRDLNEQQNRALGKRDLAGVWNNFATGFVAYSDLLTAVPTFITARDLALANGHTLADAIDIGQKTVRQAHGSAGIVDRARIQRGNEFQKVFTMFYGYFSHNYNRNRNTWREAMEGKRQLSEGEIRSFGTTALKVTTGAIFYALLPSLNHAWVRHPRDEKDSWTKWMAGALTTQFAGDIPFLRDVLTPVVSGYKAQVTPLNATAEVLNSTAKNALIVSGLRDEKLKHGAIRDAIHAGGIVLGAGTRQIGTSTEFIYDVSKNKEHPQGFGEWWRGLTTGHAKERKHH